MLVSQEGCRESMIEYLSYKYEVMYEYCTAALALQCT